MDQATLPSFRFVSWPHSEPPGRAGAGSRAAPCPWCSPRQEHSYIKVRDSPTGSLPCSAAPFHTKAHFSASQKLGEYPRTGPNSLPVSLELVAGTVAMAKCCGALLGWGLHRVLSARDTEGIEHIPGYLNKRNESASCR